THRRVPWIHQRNLGLHRHVLWIHQRVLRSHRRAPASYRHVRPLIAAISEPIDAIPGLVDPISEFIDAISGLIDSVSRVIDTIPGLSARISTLSAQNYRLVGRNRSQGAPFRGASPRGGGGMTLFPGAQPAHRQDAAKHRGQFRIDEPLLRSAVAGRELLGKRPPLDRPAPRSHHLLAAVIASSHARCESKTLAPTASARLHQHRQPLWTDSETCLDRTAKPVWTNSEACLDRQRRLLGPTSVSTIAPTCRRIRPTASQ